MQISSKDNLICDVLFSYYIVIYTQDKTRQDKTRQGKTSQDKSRQDKWRFNSFIPKELNRFTSKQGSLSTQVA